ncbi:MAG: hypothetical protein KDB02_14570 [Acidimicrobiales bacterium]|nr:hypothetical protein [Acidimicrobiales bacterium]
MLVVIPTLVILCAVAAVAAHFLRKRTTDAPEQGASWEVPVQLDRADFDHPERPWLVTVFASSTCLACKGTWAKAEVLESSAVAVQSLDNVVDKDLHDRYRVDAVPMVLIADETGRVLRSFIGEPTATDLWAAVAEVREPGSVPEGCTSDESCHT